MNSTRSATALQLLLGFLLACGLFLQLGFWSQSEDLRGPYRHNGGHAYSMDFRPKVPLPAVFHTPSSGVHVRGRLQLFEDGNRLSRQDVGAILEREGRGQFSFWGNSLAFAASDNSDPNVNGRKYSVQYPVLVRGYILAGLFAALLLIPLWKRLQIGAAGASGIATRLSTTSVAMTDRAFWTAFGIILLLAVGLRASLTWFFQVPFTQPDSGSYLTPIVHYPWLPFSQIRTMGLPLVTSLSMAVFQHPVGMLLGFHALSLGSAIGLALAIRWRLGLNAVALVMLAVLLFTPKDMSFEYLYLSEHVSRCLYVLFAAALLYFERWWLSPLYIMALCFLIVFNVLAKPSAIILVPVVFGLYLYRWFRTGEWRRALASVGLFLAVTIGAMLGYAGVYKMRFGVFNISQFEGYHFLAHVGHLIDLESGQYPDLKRELRPLIERYRQKYVAVGQYEYDWIVYGSLSDQMREDFGEQSPASVVAAYVTKNFGERSIAAINSIYTTLAWEGIRAHPLEYLRFAAERFVHLFITGHRFLLLRILAHGGACRSAS